MREYPLIDCTEKYKSVMQFDKNKNVLIHRWYPFVEGYSKEFIEDILNELPFVPQCALEPFSGSGTTPVELQNHNIKCYSFEVSPFMYLLSKVKLERTYDEKTLLFYRNKVANTLSVPIPRIREKELIPFGNTVIQKEGSHKWNFHDTSLDGILDIRYAIRTEVDDKRYNNLFSIALASIVLQISNMFRNGKCLSYKKDWKNCIYSKDEVHNLFLNKIDTVIAEDIRFISSKPTTIRNSDICYFGDTRKKIDTVPDNSIDLIITSPPYLNSRDYTDIYMLELKVLQLVNSYEELRNLRKSTIRSHVQINYSEVNTIDNQRLKQCISKMRDSKTKSWNSDILNMINGYFEDMEQLFCAFSRKMRKGGVIYFNVANSAYLGIEVPVDLILGDIAEKNGLTVREIRKARELKASPQQSKAIRKLRESVIVIDV